MKTSVFLSVTMDLDTTRRTWPISPAAAERGGAKIAYHRTIEQAKLAEELGFDWVSLTEHHYSPRILSPSPMLLAAALAVMTSKIKIALLGPLVPLSNPVRLAEEVAMLDNLSNGRIVCLFLRGTANEWLTYRTNPDETREMTQEGIELILRAWTEPEPFAWEGRYYQFRNVAAWPRMVQDPHPKMYASGNSQASIAFVAQKRMALATSFLPPPVLRVATDLYREETAKVGWTPGREDMLYRSYCYVADTQEQAEADVRDDPDLFRNLVRLHKDILTAVRGANPPVGASRPGLFGCPDAVVEQLGKLREVGIGVADICFAWPGGLSHEQRTKSMECFASKVLPQIRDL